MENIKSMKEINKSVEWIKDFYKEDEIIENDKDIPLEQMIKELKKQTYDYHKENELYYAKMNKQLKEIKDLVKYSLTEQEKQRIASMSMTELVIDMKKSLDNVKGIIDKMGRDSNGQ